MAHVVEMHLPRGVDAVAILGALRVGEEFAAMDGGMSYADVQSVIGESANVVSDPPQVLDMDLARRQIAALDALSRPTLAATEASLRPVATTRSPARKAALAISTPKPRVAPVINHVFRMRDLLGVAQPPADARAG